MRAHIRYLVFISLFFAILNGAAGARLGLRGDPGRTVGSVRTLMERSTSPDEFADATARVLRLTIAASTATQSGRRLVRNVAITTVLGLLLDAYLLLVVRQSLHRRGLFTVMLATQLIAGALCLVALSVVMTTQAEFERGFDAARGLADAAPASRPAASEVLAACEFALGRLGNTHRLAVRWFLSVSLAFVGVVLLGSAAWRHMRRNVMEPEGVTLERI